MLPYNACAFHDTRKVSLAIDGRKCVELKFYIVLHCEMLHYVFKQLHLVAPTPPVTPPFPGISGAARKPRGALPPSGLSGHQVPTYWFWWGIESCKVSDISIDNKLDAIESVPENSGIISVLSVSFRVSIVQQSIVQGLKIPFANRNSVPIESWPFFKTVKR